MKGKKRQFVDTKDFVRSSVRYFGRSMKTTYRQLTCEKLAYLPAIYVIFPIIFKRCIYRFFLFLKIHYLNRHVIFGTHGKCFVLKRWRSLTKFFWQYNEKKIYLLQNIENMIFEFVYVYLSQIVIFICVKIRWSSQKIQSFFFNISRWIRINRVGVEKIYCTLRS